MLKPISIYLRKSTVQDEHALSVAFKKSRHIHQPWIYPPADIQKYATQENLYLVCLKESKDIAGAFNISEIVRGHFHSAYLGYQVFEPYQKKGLMSQGLMLVIKEAFETLNLHRLEANIQPHNTASIKLVSKSGFVKEGYSSSYLKVGNNGWQDHERWAIINHHWTEI